MNNNIYNNLIFFNSTIIKKRNKGFFEDFKKIKFRLNIY